MQNAANLHVNPTDLNDQLSAAQREIENQKNKIEQQKTYIDQLEEFIRNLRQKQFGASSEVQNPLQVSLFDEVETDTAESLAPESITVAAHTRDAKKRYAFPLICRAKKSFTI